MWLFLTLLVIFLALLSPTDNICEFQTSFTINQHSMIDEMLCMRRANYSGNLVLSQLYFLSQLQEERPCSLRLCWQIKS